MFAKSIHAPRVCLRSELQTNLRKSTLSLWSSVNSSPATFTNPFYVACEVIYPDVTSSALRYRGFLPRHLSPCLSDVQ